ncbi:MAG: proton-conducting transporter transmembrane domain-containing protein [Candidatus Limnocylindrales bacterium]
MTLLALLVVGVLAAAGTAWALPRGGGVARVAALGGVVALALIALLAALSPNPDTVAADAAGAAPGTLWNGAIAAGGYLRLVVVLGATTSALMCALTWLLRGVPGLRGLLPASLAALVGTTVALGAATPQLGILAAGATGLASIPAVLASTRGAAAAGVAAREVRIAVATALVALAVATVIPAVARLVLANAAADAASAGSGLAAAMAFGLLVLAIVVAARMGAIPYHVRISALADTAPGGSLPLLLAWLPLPLGAVSVGVAAGDLAPLALPIGSAQALIVVLALLTTVAGGLVAAFQDDLRHAVGYLTLADLGLVVLAFAALDPVVWGPARTWLLTAAVTKTALLAWATVAEDRFQTRSVPDLRGWLRPSPMLGVALGLIVVATYGLPGWAVLTARLDLTGHAAGAPWDTLLLAASLLTLPAYARWLWLGVGAPTSHVDRAVPEFLALGGSSGSARRLALRPPARRRGRDEGLPVEQEGPSLSTSGLAGSPAPAWPPAAAPVPAPARARRAAPAPAPVDERPPRSIEPGARPESDGDGDAPDLGARPQRAAVSRFGIRPKPAAQTRPAAPSKPVAPSKAPVETKPAAETALWGAPAAAIETDLPAQPTLFAVNELDVAPNPDAQAPAQPGLGGVRAGTGMGRRPRTPNGPSGSSPMTAPRAPEASKTLPDDVLAPDVLADDLGSPDTIIRARRGRAPSGPDAAARVAAAARRHRADLLSTAVLALALLATLVASGAFDVSKAACEPTQAVPSISCS